MLPAEEEFSCCSLLADEDVNRPAPLTTNEVIVLRSLTADEEVDRPERAADEDVRRPARTSARLGEG